jgi:SPP1 family predicted phage head-tail adaptor
MAVIIRAGDLRHQVQIQQRSTQQDELGGQITVWQTIRTTFARIATVGTKDDYQAGQFSAQVSHTITVRAYAGATEILPGMQVVFGSHTYIIQAIDNAEMRNIYLNLICLEINGGQ